MDCKEFVGLLDDYMNRELPPALRAAFEEHADECHACERSRDEALTLRNRLRAEYAPPIPDGPDAFHQFKRELILKEERITPRRRLAPMRGFGLAAVFCLLVGFFLINVPVSYSLPSGIRIVINFDPPLTEAPEFEGLILPQDFYVALATDDTLIESFATVQVPDGLTSIELEISSSDPEVAARVYQTLVTNYPALEGGTVGYYGVEELKREPIRIMLRERGEMDEILSDDEINRIIIAKMPEIEVWVENEIRPLVDGIEINIEDIEDAIRNLEDIELQLDVRILNIERDVESDKNGVIKRKFIIKFDENDDLREEVIGIFREEIAFPGDVTMKIIKLDNGLLSLMDIPLDIDLDHKVKVEVNLDNLGDMIDGLDLDLDMLDEYLKGMDADNLKPFLDEFMRDLDPDMIKEYIYIWKGEFSNGDDPQASEWIEALREWIEEHKGELDHVPPLFPLGEENGFSVRVFTDSDATKFEVRVMTTDEDLDFGAKGDDIISSEILTDEDRRRLKEGEISKDDFEQILFDRLNDLELLEHDFKITVSDAEASYKIYVEDGKVTFLFTYSK